MRRGVTPSKEVKQIKSGVAPGGSLRDRFCHDGVGVGTDRARTKPKDTLWIVVD